MSVQQPVTTVKYDQETKSRETDDLLDKPWQRGQLLNTTPTVYTNHNDDDNDDGETDYTDESDAYCNEVRDEVFSLIRHIRDPEHPHTLEELRVVRRKHIAVTYNDDQLHIVVTYKPTVPHCSLATLIGLCIRTKIVNAFEGCKLDIYVQAGSHSTEAEINQQLNDKERACAAMENPPLRDTVLELTKNDTPLAYNE